MTQVLGLIDGGHASAEAASTAIEVARRERADLTFVGAVRQTGVVQPGFGGVIRRRREIDHQLRLAADRARLAGLMPTTAVRAGDAASVLRQEAAAAGSADVFLVHAPSSLWGSRGRVEVERLTAPSERPADAHDASAKAA
jgi:nucleotide-binding universal stress UspA family protein